MNRLPNFLARLIMPCWLALAMMVFPLAAEEPSRGQQIYQQQCAECHGPGGEGSEAGYGGPLVGDRSLAELTQLIVETMPEGDPEACVGEDAEAVAAFIYDAFYSPIAQARNRPARVELSRLTVRQYQNTVADLLGSFVGNGRWDQERGLNAEYFNQRRFNRDNRVIERRDATVDFDFDEGSPGEKIDAAEFSIRWRGSVMAPETGEYEIILESENGTRLWLNDNSKPLIDAWVKSGDDREFRASIFLLGGRVYPLRLEFFKYKEKTAAIKLKWKAPHQVEETIPARYLAPHWQPETFVVTTPFPPDDRSVGYERGTAISKAWHNATTYAAIDVADYVSRNLSRLAKTRDEAEDRVDKVRAFLEQFAERAFRRPLSEEERNWYIHRHLAGDQPLEESTKRITLLLLKSPFFLYRDLESQAAPSYQVASRLSFALWDSLPDKQLFDAAERGELETRDQVVRQAERMLGDLRSRSKLRQFFHQWLHVDRMHDLAKDSQLYADFKPQIAADLRTSLDLFLDEVIWSEASDYRQLLLADYVYFNGPLAQFYGADLPADADFQKVSLEPTERAGILTHPYLMAGFAYNSISSPIHRGVFLARSVLGRFLRPPPVAVAPLAPDLHADMTTRERVTLQTSPAACITCHKMINPLGFSLEHFDAVGRYRTEEKGQPIDASGVYVASSGEEVSLKGARDLALFVADSEEARQAFAKQLFHYTVKQPVMAFGSERPQMLAATFAEQNYSVKKLLVEIAAVSALTAQPESPPQ